LVADASRTNTGTQRGFTLVELMVAMALGLFLMIALLAIFLNVSRTNTEMAKTNSLVENGRFALDILSEDISYAGFWGGYTPQFDNLIVSVVPSDAPSIVPAPCLAYSATDWDTVYKNALLGIPVQSYDAVPAGCTAFITDKKPNTDVLLTRHADLCVPGVGSCAAANNAKVYFQSSFCENETGAATPVYYALGNVATDFVLKKRNCTGTPPATVGTLSDKRKFVSNMYYVRSYARTSGDGIPTLMRTTFDLASGAPSFTAPVALIEGVEGFAVDLGVDAKSRCGTNTNYGAAPAFVKPSTCTVDSATPANNTLPSNRGDGVPEMPFVRCTTASPCTNLQLREVVAVKLYVLARSRETATGHVDSKTYTLGNTTLGPFNDGFKRHLFATSVRLNNVAGRRETP
jgi:type IV pilus assembly protein PilW